MAASDPSRAGTLPQGRVVAVLNPKGGVGRTTTVLNLGEALQEEGARVLLCDLDPQGALTWCAGIDPERPGLGIADVLLRTGCSAADVVVPCPTGVDLIPSRPDLARLELMFATLPGRERRLAQALEPLRTSYHYVLIDGPPALGVLTVNAMAAADAVLVPTTCDPLALRAVDALRDLMATVREEINPALGLLGVFAAQLPGSGRLDSLAARALAGASDRFGDLLMKTAIQESEAVSEANAARRAVLSSGSDAAADYRDLARELLHRDLSTCLSKAES